MADQALNRKTAGGNVIDEAVGQALRGLRDQSRQTARDLSAASGVSAAMISRIENGQVSPSLSTLSALASALNTPIASLLRETGEAAAGVTHVKNGRGLVSARISGGRQHNFTVLGHHSRPGLEFETFLVTLSRNDGGRPPLYNGRGCLFVYVLEGKAAYIYGDREILLDAGDSLSLDAELRHGVQKVLTPQFRYLSVQARGR